MVAGTSQDYLTLNPVGGTLESPQAVFDAAGNLTQSFVYAGDHPRQRNSGASAVYYLTDGQGSVIGLTDAAGNVIGTTKYDAFGRTLEATGDMSLPVAAGGDFRFHGQWQDASSGLYHVRARDYDPETGRFLSLDPGEPDFLEPESFNRYNFANANPYLYSDPTGRFTMVSVNISINISATLQSIAVNIALDYLRDKAKSIIGSLALNALKNFTALADYNPWGDPSVIEPWDAGNAFENKIQDFLCSLLPDDLRDIVWFEPTVRSGRASANGYGCGGGTPGGAGPGTSKPDFMLSGYEPTQLGDQGFRGAKAYLIGEVKLSLKTFHDQYVGGRNRNQFNQIAIFAQKRVYAQTAVFLALKAGTSAHRTALAALLTRTAARRGILPVMVSAW